MGFKLYIFDLDGTLVDSAGDICAATVQTICEFAPAADASGVEQRVRRWIARGGPLQEIFTALAPGVATDTLVARYREIYSATCAETTRPYPGVVETLGKLRGAHRAVATTKKSWLARLLVERLKLDSYFELVQGTDGFPYKPDPEIVRRILAYFGTAPQDALLVGDTAADILCARAAGVACAAALYGIGDPEELKALQPQYLLREFSEVLACGP